MARKTSVTEVRNPPVFGTYYVRVYRDLESSPIAFFGPGGRQTTINDWWVVEGNGPKGKFKGKYPSYREAIQDAFQTRDNWKAHGYEMAVYDETGQGGASKMVNPSNPAARFVGFETPSGTPLSHHEAESRWVRRMPIHGVYEMASGERRSMSLAHGGGVGLSDAVESKRPNPSSDDVVRNRLRLKQNFLIMLAADMGNTPESFHITNHPGSPTIAQIREYVYPEWEHAIDHQIRELAASFRPVVGVPDFEELARRKQNPGPLSPSAVAGLVRGHTGESWNRGLSDGRRDMAEGISDYDSGWKSFTTWAQGEPEYAAYTDVDWENARANYIHAYSQANALNSMLRNPASVIPGINSWDTFGGGTFGGGKRAYEFRTDDQTFSINPITNERGRFIGYKLSTYPGRPAHGHQQIGRLHSSPAAAAKAAREWYAETVDRSSNPASEADTMYETFHGVPPEETVEVVEELHYHGNLTGLGDLIELKIAPLYGDKKGKLITLDMQGDNILLSCNEDGTQLYFSGGDQEMPLKAIGLSHPDFHKDNMVLGVLCELTYQTRKKFDRLKLTDYYHAAGEETGNKPMLNYNTMNRMLEVSGGSYKVEARGIVD